MIATIADKLNKNEMIEEKDFTDITNLPSSSIAANFNDLSKLV